MAAISRRRACRPTLRCARCRRNSSSSSTTAARCRSPTPTPTFASRRWRQAIAIRIAGARGLCGALSKRTRRSHGACARTRFRRAARQRINLRSGACALVAALGVDALAHAAHLVMRPYRSTRARLPRAVYLGARAQRRRLLRRASRAPSVAGARANSPPRRAGGRTMASTNCASRPGALFCCPTPNEAARAKHRGAAARPRPHRRRPTTRASPSSPAPARPNVRRRWAKRARISPRLAPLAKKLVGADGVGLHSLAARRAALRRAATPSRSSPTRTASISSRTARAERRAACSASLTIDAVIARYRARAAERA